MSWEGIIVCLIVFGVPYLLLAVTEAKPGKPLAITRHYWFNVALGLLIVPVVALLAYMLFGAASFAVLVPVTLALSLLIELGLGWVVLVGLGVLALWMAYSVGKQGGRRQTVREPEIDPEVALQVYTAALAKPRRERVDVPDARWDSQGQSHLQRAEALVHAYTNVLQVASGVAVDEARLPEPKDNIKAALLLWLSVEQDRQTIELLRAVYIQLARFQPGIGDAQLSLNSFLKSHPLRSHPNDEDILEHANALGPHMQEIQRWEGIVAQEERQLMAELEHAGFGPS